jgi:hypothetical protein
MIQVEGAHVDYSGYANSNAATGQQFGSTLAFSSGEALEAAAFPFLPARMNW